MTKLIGLLLDFLGVGGVVISFFEYIGKKIAVKAVLLPIQYALVGALIVVRLSFASAFFILLVKIYNLMKDTLDSLPSLMSSSQALDIGYKLLQAIGFIDAFYNVFASFTLVWISLFVLIATKFFKNFMIETSEDFFRIGVLLGL